MKVLVFSEQDQKKNNINWIREGNNIDYYENNYKLAYPGIIFKKNNSKIIGAEQKKLYTLSFKYTFQYGNDTVSFAYAQPYTYEDLKETLLLSERNSR